jgi:IS6 family transposase
MVAVRWYLRYGLSYRDVEELLAERGIEVDHVTVFRWVQRFTPLLIDAARPCRHVPGDRWFVDETLRQGRRQVGLSVPGDRPVRAGHRRAGLPEAGHSGDPPILHPRTRARAVSNRGHHRQSSGLPARPRRDRPGSLAPPERYANNRIESDHGRLKSRLRSMRGLKQLRCTRVISAGHAFIQNLRRGHYELGTEETVNLRVLAAFDELTLAI